MQMALPKKKISKFFCDEILLAKLPYLYLTATNNKEFTSSLTSFCGESKNNKKTPEGVYAGCVGLRKNRIIK